MNTKTFIVFLSNSIVTLDVDCDVFTDLNNQIWEASAKAIEAIVKKKTDDPLILSIEKLDKTSKEHFEEIGGEEVTEDSVTRCLLKLMSDEIIPGVGKIICISTHINGEVEEWYLHSERVLCNAGIDLKKIGKKV